MRNHAQALRQPKPGEPAQQQPEETSMAIPPKADQRMAQVREDLQALAPELPPEGLAILAAQAGHESREGDSEGAQHGNMFGHKQSGKRPGFSANTTEGEGAGAVRLKQNFASYGSITESVADHLSLLKRNYPIAWEALEVGDVDAYVAALKDGGYFTANEAVYKNALQRRL
jgi:hypothetical protein